MPWQRGHTLSIFSALCLSQRNQGSLGALTQLASLPRLPSPSFHSALLSLSVTLCLAALSSPSPGYCHIPIYLRFHSPVSCISLSLFFPSVSSFLLPAFPSVWCSGLSQPDRSQNCKDNNNKKSPDVHLSLQRDQRNESRSAAEINIHIDMNCNDCD